MKLATPLLRRMFNAPADDLAVTVEQGVLEFPTHAYLVWCAHCFVSFAAPLYTLRAVAVPYAEWQFIAVICVRRHYSSPWQVYLLFLICLGARPDIDKRTRKAAIAAAEEHVLRYGLFVRYVDQWHAVRASF